MVSKEMEYILKNREALKKEYSGKYIAVHQEEIVASGRTIHEVYSVVEELNISNPLVTYVQERVKSTSCMKFLFVSN